MAAQSFEKQMQRLEEIVRELESPDLPLEKSVALYREGRAVARACGELLEKARHDILLCDEEGERSFASAPATPESGERAE
ncbi:MAG: exodeoxyribonuclease VII small subunit [Desulfovibrio sp.]|jgi:exodeoxyribonuclease VII small subunit|nr:exodeoxyribonuclease VII small subunit [Desulfovibrio sp.]